MKRMKVLFGNRRMMVLLTLAILVLAATALVASSASFTATSENISNTFTAGSLSLANSGLSFTTGPNPMMPGDSRQGSVTLTNDGDGSADIYLSVTNIANTHLGTGTADLSDTLHLVVNDGTSNVYDDQIDLPALAAGVDLGPLAGGSSLTYTFTVTFPDSDAAPATTKGSDNIYQGCVSVVDFGWEAVSN